MRRHGAGKSAHHLHRWVALGASIVVVTASMVGTAAPASATGADPAASDVVKGLIQLGQAIAGSATQPALSTKLPLTDLSVRDVLALDTVVGTHVDDAVTGSSATLSSLPGILNADSMLHMATASSPAGAPAGSRDWVFTVDITNTTPVPLTYNDGRLQFGAAQLDGVLAGELTGSFRVRYDPNALPLRKFSVVGDSTVTTHVWSRLSGGHQTSGQSLAANAFPVVDGFIQLTAAGSGTIDTTTQLRLRDPNGRGALTTEDLMLSSADEMFTTTQAPGVDDVHINLGLSSGLLSSGSHGTVVVDTRPTASTAPYSSPVVTRDTALSDLTALTRPQALSGFTQFTSAIKAAEDSVDASLPLLSAKLTDLYSPGNQLMNLLSQQAVATIQCGAADTVPPTGAPRPGQARYCDATTQGLTVDDGTSITWASPESGVSITGDGAGTVGTSPTGNVRVTGGGGFPVLTVTFTSGGTQRTARTLMTSVQELSSAVNALGLGGALSYDSAKRSLEVAVAQNDATTRTTSVATGGNGNLAPLTGLTGLCQAEAGSSPRQCPHTGDNPAGGAFAAPATGDASVTTSDREIAATFGIGLVPTASAPQAGDPAPAQPVTYLKPGADGLLWRVGSVTASMSNNAPMVARIGFLQVDVDVSDYTVTTGASSAAAQVTVPTGDVAIDGGTVSDAVDVSKIAGTETATGPDVVTPAATRSLTASAHLYVQDSPEADGTTRPIGASGTVDATWHSLAATALPSVSTSDDYDTLRALDIVPSRQGVMGAGSDNATLVDASADFLTEFGLTASSSDKTVTRQLYDLDAESNDATVCSAFTVVSATELTCTSGPLAHTVIGHTTGGANIYSGDMNPGHHYVINGDPTALRDVLIQDFASVMSTYATPDASLGAGRTLPLVDLLPSDIDAARNALNHALVGIQGDTGADHPATDVSSLQGFAAAVQHYAPQSVNAFTLDTANNRLEFTTSDSTSAATTFAPLRIATGASELRITDGIDPATGDPAVVKLPLRTSSDANLHLGINLSDASSYVGNDTAVSESVAGFQSSAANVHASLAGKNAAFGSAAVKTGAAGSIAVGLGVDVNTAPKSGSPTWISLASFRASLEQARTVHGTAQTCGGASGSDIAACASIPLVDPASPSTTLSTVNVALKATDSSGGSGANLAAQPLVYRFMADGLTAFSRTLRDSLDGELMDKSMPLVGTDLDGGADIPNAVTAYTSAARKALAAVTDGETTKVTDFQTHLQKALKDLTVAGVSHNDPTVSVDCDGTCAADATVADVKEISAPITLSGNKTGEHSTFRPGLAGMALDSNLQVPTTTNWTLNVTVGIQRGSGPYLLMKPAGSASSVDVLSATVTAHLPQYNSNNCHAWDREADWETKLNADAHTNLAANSYAPTSQNASSNCIDAFVGKLPSVLVDRVDTTAGGNHTSLDAEVDVAITPGDSADTDGRVYLPALFEKKVGIDTAVSGDGGIDVYFESYAASLGFFDVMGTIDLDWHDGVFDEAGEKFGHLLIDAKTVYDILDVGYAKAKQWLAPLNPVVDLLSAPIPVVSQLSQMVGGGPISMLSILTKAHWGGALITNLLQFQQLIARLPGSEGTELVDLGSGEGGAFHLPMKTLQFNSCSKTVDMTKQGGLAFTAKSSGVGTNGRCDESAASRIKRLRDGTAPKDPTAGKNIQKQMTKSPYFSLPSISVPVLEDANQVYDLLTGHGNSTLLYVDLGHAGGKVAMVRNFGPFMVGPVPIVASIGGEIGLDGRFAFGFDTKGLSDQIDALDDPTDVHGLHSLSRGQVFSDGFFIDDLEKGVDVPEIKLTFTVQAGASVSIGFAEAGIRGGVTLDLSLDAFDPNNDGKIYTSEFAGGTGPDCAFNVSSGLTFFLSFYLHIDLFITSIDKSWDIFRSPRIPIFTFNCSTVTPQLAIKVGSNLVLTTGSHSGSRLAYTSVIDEKYTVRQTAATASTGTSVEIRAFNLVQDYTIPAGGRLVADGGSGNDTIKLLPGQLLSKDSDGSDVVTDVPFTAPATIDGGAGDDTIVTGGGGDSLTGGDGNDSIDAGAGDDTVSGNNNDDQIDGGPGQDVLNGNSGNDRISGGAGADEVLGGAGDDTLDGGIGADPASLFPTTDASVIGPLLDSGDVVVGGDGSDHVTGGDGSDVVSGGDYDVSAIAFSGTQSKTVYGVSPTGVLVAVAASTPTVTLPSLTAVRAECADAGVAGSGHDDVTGGDDRDYVLGGGGDDTLAGGGANDVVCGRGGNDMLEGDGAEVLAVDQGGDELRGGPGADRMYGEGGADTMYGDGGSDLVRGGDGGDTLQGGGGTDLILGESGSDRIYGDDQPPTSEASSTDTARKITCAPTTSVIAGGIDLNDDLSANSLDDGLLEGLNVVDGVVKDTSGASFNGVLGNTVFINGLADLNGSGAIQGRTATALNDTGVVDLAGTTGGVGDGDCILGGDGVDGINGQQGGDFIDAGDGNDTSVHGGTGDDFMRGGTGNDALHGDAGDDLVVGDGGNDIAYGDGGDDVVRGASGNDLLAGGSNVDLAADGRDQVLGDGGDDVLTGGNAVLSFAPTPTTAIPGVSVFLSTTTVTDTSSANAAGIPAGIDDQLYGGYGNDWAFGESGNDQVYGGPDGDVVEGNAGDDLVQGDDGNDLVVGGSSGGNEASVTLSRSGEGESDGNDTVVGDEGVDGQDGSDILVGDNARLQPPPTSGAVNRTRWAGIRPTVGVTLFDLPTTAAPGASTSGDDTMRGDGGNDLILGQSGNDTISGGAGDDAIEGNAGSDTVNGGADNDSIIGGSWTAGSYDKNVAGVGDTLNGDAGNDRIIGDNGTITSQVQLLDVAAATDASSTTYGDDAINGGDGNDAEFGQGGNDGLHGNDGLDALEGDAGNDALYGDAGDDALTGGSSATDGLITASRSGAAMVDGSDTLNGGDGDDVLAGDNARVDRPSGAARADGSTLRTIQLFDVPTSGAAPSVGAADVLNGNAGRDLMFGQAGNDTLSGADGDDVAEGGSGNDVISGDGGQDDLTGGSSSSSGAVISGPGSGDRLLTPIPVATLVDSSAAGVTDANDTIYGGTAPGAPSAGSQADGSDVLLGDNGRITRDGTTLGGGSGGSSHAVRQVAMADSGAGAWSGSDALYGQAGDDELYGQFDNTAGAAATQQSFSGLTVPGDLLDGGDGDDALIGDQGVDVPTPAASLGAVNTTLSSNSGWTSELVRPAGTLVRKVTQTQPTVGGADLIFGGAGFDSIHAGAGADVVNAGTGDDVVFGGDDSDALWGGTGHDRLFGGSGDDFIDTKHRATDPALWTAAAPVEDTDNLKATVNGLDTAYGGSGHDMMQADMGDQGRTVGDRLIDWNGIYNLYLVCGGAYGAGKVQKAPDPSTQSLLTSLAAATGSVGGAEVALVAAGAETSPGYPGAPGNFTCETG